MNNGRERRQGFHALTLRTSLPETTWMTDVPGRYKQSTLLLTTMKIPNILWFIISMVSHHGHYVLFGDTKLQQKKPHVKGFNSNS